MTPDALLTIAITVSVLVALVVSRTGPDIVLMAALTALTVTGILSASDALAGFANPGVMTIAALYVVAGGLKETGAMHYLSARLLGQPETLRRAQARLMLPTAALSAFMNNTAVVAMLIPTVQQWARRIRLPASRLLLPLSYAAILGGTLTLIGTSTNLVVDGLLQSEQGIALSLFALTPLGLLILAAGVIYLLVAGRWLLPERQGLIEQLHDARQYSVEMHLPAGSPLANKTVRGAGLRNLPNSYLAGVEREGQALESVSANTLLQSGDRLFFIGAPEGARDLRNINGLIPANGNVQSLNIANHQRRLVEVVLGPDFQYLGETIRDAAFRSHFQALVLAVSRNGERIPGKLGDIRLEAGDTLLLEAGQGFVEQYRYRRDFLLVSALNDSAPPDFHKAPVALALLAFMVLLAGTGLLSILHAALLTAGAMLATRCITGTQARRSVDLSVLIVIAAAFALGTAISQTGLAAQLAETALSTGSLTPWVALALVYVSTVVATEMITNNAAAVLMFPIATAMAEQLGVSVMPFAIAIMFAASASFMTPLGYQTNLMVLGPGGYRFTDYLKVGAPLSLISGLICIGVIPLLWPFG